MIQSDNRIVLVNTANETYGLLVDQASEVIEIGDDDVYSLPSSLGNASQYFDGIVSKGEQLLLRLATDRLNEDPSQREPFAPAETQNVFNPDQTVPVSSSNGRRQLLMFSPARSVLQNCLLGVSLTQVLEILEPLPLTPVPCAPDYVLGLANWRKQPVPVIDLNSRFGLVSSLGSMKPAKSESRLLIARAAHSSRLCGFLIQPNPKTQGLPIPHEPCTGKFPIPRIWTRGVFELEHEEMLVLPDLDRLIA